MKKFTNGVAILSILLAAGTANAGHSAYQAKIRAWVAESTEWRLSHLPRAYQTADVFSITDSVPNPADLHGAAWIKRSRNGISGRIMANVDTAGTPHTVWWVVFNNPGACVLSPGGPCLPSDLFNPDVAASIYSASAAISTSDGNGGGVINVDVDTVAGNLPNGMFLLLGDPDGLHRGNGFGAEVHLVIDFHPDFEPGDMNQNSWVIDLTQPGPRGPNANHRAAVFPAVD
jgi:hypothetical protein